MFSLQLHLFKSGRNPSQYAVNFPPKSNWICKHQENEAAKPVKQTSCQIVCLLPMATILQHPGLSVEILPLLFHSYNCSFILSRVDKNDNSNDTSFYLEKRDFCLLEVKQQEFKACYLDGCTLLIINRYFSALYRFDFLLTTEGILATSL